jgi:hypothetical protein
MPKVIPFQRRHRNGTAAYALELSARWQRRRKKPLVRPERPERLGNMLQRLIVKRPAVVLVIENLVADLLKELE